jgi:hypothetical protein
LSRPFSKSHLGPHSSSGPTTFGSIEAPKGFPDQLPAVQSVDESVKGLDTRLVSLESKDSSDKASTALLIAIVGVIVGSRGLAAGAYGLTRKTSA